MIKIYLCLRCRSFSQLRWGCEGWLRCGMWLNARALSRAGTREYIHEAAACLWKWPIITGINKARHEPSTRSLELRRKCKIRPHIASSTDYLCAQCRVRGKFICVVCQWLWY